jgi:glycosyltransferase involved in cell wall biosynthesis
VATYGPHVSAYVRARGARNVVEAPQGVDVAFWSAPATRDERRAPLQITFAGRAVREKGIQTLMQAWARSGFRAPSAALVLVGGGHSRSPAPAASAVTDVGFLPPPEVRNFLAAADVVVVPSVPTRTFREPWGLIVNEAMCQRTAIIASDAVGAAAGGLVRDGETGVVVPAGDPDALAAALRRLGEDPAERERLGTAGKAAASALTFDAWADGMSRALRGSGRGRW